MDKFVLNVIRMGNIMIVSFSVSNFLSFNEQQTMSMEAGKARKHVSRIYKNRSLRVLKFMSLFGGNAVGKSNLIKGINFMRHMVISGLPRGFSNSYYRGNSANKEKVSEFNMVFLLNNRRYEYGFSIILSKGAIINEYLYRLQLNGTKKCIFKRSVQDHNFEVGEQIKLTKNQNRMKIYGEDSLLNKNSLFLHIINQEKDALYNENSELNILKDIYNWFRRGLSINRTDELLSERPFYTDSNITEIGEILKGLGLGITDFRYIDISMERIQNILPEEILEDVLSDLEKENIESNSGRGIVLRSNKEFYTFRMNEDGQVRIQTLAFQHEKPGIYYNLNEESDGTARIFDLVEILLPTTEDKVFVIDEVDRGLHPVITTKLIEAFLAMTELRSTQLIVTTHESRLLDRDLLRSDEVNFVVKDGDGVSSIKRLEDFNLRSDKSILTAMFDGSLDEVNPDIDYEKLINVVKNRQAKNVQ